MKFKFHHLNLCTDSLPRLTKFYQTLFDLGTIRDEEHTRVNAESASTLFHCGDCPPRPPRHLGVRHPRQERLLKDTVGVGLAATKPA